MTPIVIASEARQSSFLFSLDCRVATAPGNDGLGEPS
jgi:hypothetical protein